MAPRPRKPIKAAKAHPAAAIKSQSPPDVKLPWWLWNNKMIKDQMRSQQEFDNREMDRIRAENAARTPPIWSKHNKSWGTYGDGSGWVAYTDGSKSDRGKFTPAPKKGKR